MRRFAELVVRRRAWVVGIWLLALLALVPAAARVEHSLDVSATVDGSESGVVDSLLAGRFDSPFARFAVLVIDDVPAPGSPEGRALLARVVENVAAVPGVSGTLSYLDGADSLFIGAGGHGTFVIVGLDARGQPERLVEPLRASTRRLGAELRATHPEMTLRWTGETPVNVDIREASARESRRGEQRVLPLTLVLLLVAFGTVAAAVLPIAAGALAIVITLGLAVVIHSVYPLSVLLQNTVSMIGLGLGIDYALLTVSRFREAVAAGLGRHAAAVEAAHHAGSTIVLSGAAVFIGFAALLLLPLSEIRSIGVGGMIVVAVSVLIAATLLPALLALLGRRVEAGRLLPKRLGLPSTDRMWAAWGRGVVARPVLVLILASAPLLLLGWQATRMRTDLPRGNWLPAEMESAAALADLADMRRDGIASTLRVVVAAPAGRTVLDDDAWAALGRTTAYLQADPRVARAQSLASILPQPSMYRMLPAETLRGLLSEDRRYGLIEVIPAPGVHFNDVSELAREIAALDDVSLTGLPGADVLVGGLPAFNAEYLDVLRRGLPGVIGLVVLATLLALVIGLRSLLVPIKAVALNLVSVAAAFGAVVLVFQDGYGARFIGLDAPLSAVFPAVPVLVFCIVFGLSMDYEIFLVTRVREARLRLGEADAIVEGLSKTGAVITSAAAVMVVVFGAFTLGDFLFVKVLGFALAVAVLVDATLVRLAIGPALLRLGGRWNWWPGDRLRRQHDAARATATSSLPPMHDARS
ncbi:MAG TPA: MMPL family transporter [Longimicrobiales bacterium]|nr:MMPL family transporter [Longimicrobiales bacterium]